MEGDSYAAFEYGKHVMEMCEFAAGISAMEEGVDIVEWKRPGAGFTDRYDADMQKAIAYGLLSDFASPRAAAATAVSYLRQAAAAGEDRAAYNLGVVFAVGLLVPEDMQVSRNWFNLAALSPVDDVGRTAKLALVRLLTFDSQWRLLSHDLRSFMHPLPGTGIAA